MESEFIALDKVGEEAEWLLNFLKNISNWPKHMLKISIHCDSQSVIERVKNTMYNNKSRHIHRKHNTIRQLLSNSIISVDYVKSKKNLANSLTKSLPRE